MIFAASRSNTFWIAEEAGDVDQQIAREQIELGWVASQHLEITSHVAGLDRRHRHAPLYPALQGAGLVQREIMRGPGAEKVDDLGQPVSCLVRAEPKRHRDGSGSIAGRAWRAHREFWPPAAQDRPAPVMIALRGMPS